MRAGMDRRGDAGRRVRLARRLADVIPAHPGSNFACRTKKPAQAGFFVATGRNYFFVVSVLLDDALDDGVLEVEELVLPDGLLLPLFEASTFTDVLLEPGVVLDALPLGVVEELDDVSVDGVVVPAVVDDEDELPVEGVAVLDELGDVLLEDDDEGGGVVVEVSVLEQPTTPTPAARRAARR